MAIKYTMVQTLIIALLAILLLVISTLFFTQERTNKVDPENGEEETVEKPLKNREDEIEEKLTKILEKVTTISEILGGEQTEEEAAEEAAFLENFWKYEEGMYESERTDEEVSAAIYGQNYLKMREEAEKEEGKENE